MLRKFWPVALIAVLVALLGSQVLVSIRHAAGDAAAHTRLEIAQKDAKASLALADNALAVAKRATDSAATYRAQRDSLNRRANSLQTSVAELKGQFRQASLAAPDTCRPVIELAAITIDSLTELAQTQEARARVDSSTIVELSLALDSTQTALKSTRLSLGYLGKAADEAEHAARPSLLSRILPHAGFGGAAGIDAFGRPNAVIGVTFGWAI